MRKLIEGLRRHQHPPQRRNWQIDAHHFRNRRSPCSCAIHNDAGCDRSARRFDFRDPAIISSDRSYGGVLPQGRAMFRGPCHEPDHRADFEPGFIEKILMRAADRVPCFENLAVNPKRAWAGLYEMTPDHHPILGEVPGVPGFFCANGFSGHGVMHAPATGKILSDLILNSKTDLIDAALLNYSRFAEGRMIHETAVL
jgi:glycine/D-amino acid oxidase-like deaminating enzyme